MSDRTIAIVLAGGQSRRMNPLGDKLLLPHVQCGIPILAQVIRTLSTVAPDVYVTYASQLVRQAVEPHLYSSVHWILDPPHTQGPLQALGHVFTSITLLPEVSSIAVVAGDIPGLSLDVLRACAQTMGLLPCDGAAVLYEGRLQPLFCVYHPRALQAFHDAALRGETRLMRVVESLSMVPISLSTHVPEWAVRPVHTPTDYNAYRAWRDALETS